MELNAPRWKETIRQGEIRSSMLGDVVTQDNIGSPLNKANANYDDHSNRRFLRWLAIRCAGANGSANGSASTEGRVGCSPAVLQAMRNTSFNIRDHIAATRAATPPLGPQHAAMEKCGASQFGPQDMQQVSPGSVPRPIEFEDGKCLTTTNDTR